MRTSSAGGCASGSFPLAGSTVRELVSLVVGGVAMLEAGRGFAPGRPEKLPDVCYSWWVLSSLKMIGRLHWISKV